MRLNHAMLDILRPHYVRSVRRAFPILCSCAFAIIAFAPPLIAQADPDSVKLRNDCRFATQVLTTGHPGPHRADAFSTISRCGSSGLTVIADLWEHGTLDSAEVPLLATSTRPYPQDVLAEPLLRVAAAASRPRIVRLYAMSVLVTFLDPTLLVPPEHLIGDKHYTFDWTSHAEAQIGRERLTIPLRGRLIALEEQLAANDPDPVIRKAAEHMLLNLRE